MNVHRKDVSVLVGEVPSVFFAASELGDLASIAIKVASFFLELCMVSKGQFQKCA